MLYDQEHTQEVEMFYHTLEMQSLEADIGILLLPSVVSTTPPELSTDGTIMDRIAVAGSIKKLEDERDKAVREARLYRDLAERLRKETGALQHEMRRRCEGIRDF